jgi:hypothetical protein
MGRLFCFTSRLRKVIKARFRLLAAFLLLVIIIIVFVTAIRKDFNSKVEQLFLAGIAIGKLNYILTFNSIDWNNETINGTLGFKEGLPIWEEKEVKILYGELVCKDLTHTYLIWPKEYADSMADLLMMSLQKKSSFK